MEIIQDKTERHRDPARKQEKPCQETAALPESNRIDQPGPGDSSNTVRMVVFKVAGHEHALDVHRIKEIVIAGEISPVIEAPDFMAGAMKVRGRVLPIVDLAKRLNLPGRERTYEACVIVVRDRKRRVGLLVDSVSELLRVPVKEIQVPDEILGGPRTRFMDGVVYVGDRLLIVLNLDEILTLIGEDLGDGDCCERMD
jgi:purine-binding chemotaxis protein CheW